MSVEKLQKIIDDSKKIAFFVGGPGELFIALGCPQGRF